MLVIAYPKQYFDYVKSHVSPHRSPQHVRMVDNVESDQILGLLQHAYHSDFPLVIRGGVSHWPAVGRWSPRHMRQEVGEDAWILLQTGVQEQEASPFINTTMGAFTEWLERQDDNINMKKSNAPTYYLAEEFDFIEHHAGLVDELGLHDLDSFWDRKETGLSGLMGWWDGPRRSNSLESLEHSEGFETAFWMGGAGARTGWHIDHDYPLNVLCHLYGTKTLWIAAPDQGDRMYPSNKYDPGAVLGNVNFWNPKHDLYPKYRTATYEKIVLEPGDVLFIPMGYWHAAESTTYTASLSLRSMTSWYWFVNFPDRLLEQLFFQGWWEPSHGSVAIEKTIERKEL